MYSIFFYNEQQQYWNIFKLIHSVLGQDNWCTTGMVNIHQSHYWISQNSFFLLWRQWMTSVNLLFAKQEENITTINAKLESRMVSPLMLCIWQKASSKWNCMECMFAYLSCCNLQHNYFLLQRKNTIKYILYISNHKSFIHKPVSNKCIVKLTER